MVGTAALHLEAAAAVVLCDEMALAAVDLGVARSAAVFGAAFAAGALGATGVVAVVGELEGAAGALAGDIPVVSTAELAGALDAAGKAGLTGLCRREAVPPEKLGELPIESEGA